MLGILSIVVCQLLGPFAWKMGNDELRAITEGRRSPEGRTGSGREDLRHCRDLSVGPGRGLLPVLPGGCLVGFGIFVAESS